MKPSATSASTRVAGPSLRWGDVWLGLGFGALVGLTVVSLPIVVSLVLVGALGALAAMTAQRRVDTWGRGLLLATAFTQPMNGRFLIPLPLGDGLLVLTLGAYVVIRLRGGTATGPFAHRPILIGLGLLAAGGFLGALVEAPGALWYQGTAYPLTDVTGWAHNMQAFSAFIAGSLVPMTLWALVRPNRAFVRQILQAFVAGCAISVAVGYIVPSARGGGRVMGLALHPLQLGSISLVGVGAAVALTVSQPRIPSWAYGVLPLLALGIIGSGSRSALGGLLVLGLIIGPLTRRRAVIGAVLATTAIAIVLLASGAFRDEGQNAIGRTLGGDPSAEHSTEIRGELRDRVFNRWLLRPLTGNGFNHMRPAHNVYLGVIASAGLLGALGLGTIILTVLRRAWRRRADMMAVGVAAGYVAYLVSAYYDYLLWWRWLWFYVGLTVAVLATSPGAGEIGADRKASTGPGASADAPTAALERRRRTAID